ncbi:PKD-like family lipoprotein [Pedobacter gandavensis]|uniref:PKD-like family lipoprotein n=1 Tax=Pedobacter gandavensis TaxID=2679963 RepID=UPI0029315845|nr:PKD-like family lipoprotein [Pedobacter gandavensis]
MKRFFNHLLFIPLVGLLFASCYKDKGNYDLKPVNSISLEGPAYRPDNYSLVQLDSLKITPIVKFTGDSTQLQYSWKLIPVKAKMGDTTIKTVSIQRNLNYAIRVPIGEYIIQLEVRDPGTSLARSQTYGLNVRAKASQGFLVLNEKADGFQDIDVILNNTKDEVFYGAFSTNNSIRLKDATSLSMIQSLANASGLLYVFMKNGGYTLLPSFGLLQQSPAWFFYAPEAYAPTVMYQDFSGMNNYVINNGSLHTTTGSSTPLMFGYRASGNYKASKSLLMSSYAFIYDDLNHRFLKFNKPAGKMMPITRNPADAFNVDDIGDKTCLLFDHNMPTGTAPSATNFGSLKPIAYGKDNQTGKTFVYKFGFYKSLVTYCESVKEVTAPGFSSATAYANASNNPLTYYAVDNKIYVYDFNNDVARVVYTFEQSNVSIDLLMTNGAQFLAAVNSKTEKKGSVYFFKVDPSGTFSNQTFFSKYDSFGKILDIEYKFSSLNPSVTWK